MESPNASREAQRRMKENALDLSAFRGRIEQMLARISLDFFRSMTGIFEQETMPFVPNARYRPHVEELLMSLGNRHMTHAARAFWRIQLTRRKALTVATDDAPFTPYDPLIVMVRNLPDEDRWRTFHDLRRLTPLYDKVLAPQALALQSMLTSYLPSAQIGTAVSIPELCHDMVFTCPRCVGKPPVCANKGCLDSEFFASVVTKTPLSKYLFVNVQPSVTESNVIIGSISLPVSFLWQTRRIVAEVEIVRLYDRVDETPLPTTQAILGVTEVPMLSLFRYLAPQLSSATLTPSFLVGALVPFVILHERRWGGADAILRRLHGWDVFDHNADDPYMHAVAMLLRSHRRRLKPADEVSFKTKVREIYRLTIDCLMASQAVRKSAFGELGTLAYFDPKTLED